MTGAKDGTSTKIFIVSADGTAHTLLEFSHDSTGWRLVAIESCAGE